jgi:hypothetical protein
VKRQPAQLPAAGVSGMFDHRREIEAGARSAGDRAAVHRAQNIDEADFGFKPAIEGKALQGDGHEILPLAACVNRDLMQMAAVDTLAASSNN